MPIHHPDVIRPIVPGERVLEVGPGAFPWPRADVLCDRYSRSDPDTLRQDGFAARPRYPQAVVIYEGARLPFADGAFDYAVCSHVLEHVDPAELELFIAELKRVARGGYLEFPRYLLELQGNVAVHRWLLNVVDGEIRMLEKARVQAFVEQASRLIGAAYSRLTEVSPGYQQVYRHHTALWVCGLEWSGRIPVRVVETWEELLEGDTHLERAAAAAAGEWEEQRLVPRALAAVRRSLGRGAPASEETCREARAGLPPWLGETVRCPQCGETRLEFGKERASCSGCGARFAADGLEYYLSKPERSWD